MIAWLLWLFTLLKLVAGNISFSGKLILVNSNFNLYEGMYSVFSPGEEGESLKIYVLKKGASVVKHWNLRVPAWIYPKWNATCYEFNKAMKLSKSYNNVYMPSPFFSCNYMKRYFWSIFISYLPFFWYVSLIYGWKVNLLSCIIGHASGQVIKK